MKFKILNLKLKITDFVRKNKIELIILGVILLVGSFCRLYRISEYMVFLGDEGRDAIITRRIFTELHPPLIGPGTSVGSMYLGPLYYYMMAIPLLIAGFSPVGPAIMVAILGVLTIAFVWWVEKTWFGRSAGLIAAALYSISPTTIIYSHSSWNPNIMPFFALLCIYSIWKVWRQKNNNWLIVLGIAYAFVLQSHYLGLLLAPTLLLFWILALRNLRLIKNSKFEIKNFWKKTILGIGFFLILMSPLLIFDIRHDWMNVRSIYKFIAERQTNFSVDLVFTASRLPQILNLINKSLIAGKNSLIAVFFSVISVIGILYVSVKSRNGKKKEAVKPEYWMLFSWLAFSLAGFAIYKQNIYDHYFGFLFPVPFFIAGIIISKLISGKIAMKILGSVLLTCLVLVNLSVNPLLKEPNRLLQRSMHVSKVIEENSKGQKFNIAVIADTNYEAGYKYFLLKDRYPVVDIDSQVAESVTEQLFVICELLPNSKCDPTHSPKAEVANFGWSKIENSWEVDGTIVYKLVHTK